MAEIAAADKQKGILGWIERTGNKLPDPVFIFIYLVGGLVVVSIIAALAGLSAVHPTRIDAETGAPVTIAAQSLISAENLRRLWIDMPATFTHFHPLGYVLVVMLGAGVAECSGLFGTAMRASVANAPAVLLTPMVAFVAMMGNLAADAAYVVLVPLAGIIYAAAGRHPIAGIAAAFAGVSGGFSANLLPGQLDALLFGITQEAAQLLDPDWTINIAGNWFFMAALLVFYIPAIWYVTDRIIEPRLGSYIPQGEAALIAGAVEDAAEGEGRLSDAQRKGLRWGGLAMLAVVGLWALMTLVPGAPLLDANASLPEARLTPFYQSLVAGFFLLFLAGGWAYGKAAGTIRDHRDVVKMMTGAMSDLAYYLVLAFAAAHFVAMFGWSNLGLIFAIHGASGLEAVALPTPLLLVLLVMFTTVLNLFIGSASAKWALLAPVLVPMLMLLGISAETTTAAYRVGDGATNIISPLMVYFPLILIYCQRWVGNFGLGSLAAMMLPYSFWLLAVGLALLVGWTVLEIPLGPNAPVHLSVPEVVTAG